MGDCQNYGPFLGPYYNTGPNLGDPKRDHNFDNPPYNPKSQTFQAQDAAPMVAYEKNGLKVTFFPRKEAMGSCSGFKAEGLGALRVLAFRA